MSKKRKKWAFTKGFLNDITKSPKHSILSVLFYAEDSSSALTEIPKFSTSFHFYYEIHPGLMK